MYLRKLDEKHIKSIVSIALWKTITSYERYFFDDTLIRCGEKVIVYFVHCTLSIEHVITCLKKQTFWWSALSFVLTVVRFYHILVKIVPKRIKKTVRQLHCLVESNFAGTLCGSVGKHVYHRVYCQTRYPWFKSRSNQLIIHLTDIS